MTSKGGKISDLIAETLDAEAVLVNSGERVCALRARHGKNTVIQLVELETKKRISSFEVDDHLIYWKWSGETTLALVGTRVYHVETR
jgi:clathrin heavy chain